MILRSFTIKELKNIQKFAIIELCYTLSLILNNQPFNTGNNVKKFRKNTLKKFTQNIVQLSKINFKWNNLNFTNSKLREVFFLCV